MSAILTITGNIGKAPEVKTLPSGADVAEFSVAVSHYKGKDSEKTTSWFYVKVFGKAVEAVRRWNKGDCVLVSGNLELREWTDRDGAKRMSPELNASQFENFSLFVNRDGAQRGGYEPRPAAAPRPKAEEEDLPF